jgi:retron-type reverse transcriptase
MWQLSKPRTRNGFGVDGESINAVRPIVEQVVQALSLSLRSAEGYQFRGLRPYVAIKPNGKKRVICVPTVRDRIVQRAALQFLSDGDKLSLANSVSFGFVPGRGVELAAETACKKRKAQPYVYKTDISAFFDNVDRSQLERLVNTVVRQRTLRSLLIRALHTEIDEQDPRVLRDIADAKIVSGKGVRQGMPLSPFFANLYLRSFDKAVVRAGLNMVRYADDLIFLAADQEKCHEIHRFVVDQLGQLGLSVPDFGVDSKTKISTPDQAAEFLGVELTPATSGSYVLQITGPQIRKACDRIKSVCDSGKARLTGSTLTVIQNNVAAVKTGYLEAYRFTNNIHELERFLNVAHGKEISQLIRNMTGIDVGSLPPAARQFLGA